MNGLMPESACACMRACVRVGGGGEGVPEQVNLRRWRGPMQAMVCVFAWDCATMSL